jgi:pimeloyl-ACP methyl ester carboxylesterase
MSHRVYAIDLLGYGFADKPSPRDMTPNTLYTFETWGNQILDFCSDVVNDRAFVICNSVGGSCHSSYAFIFCIFGVIEFDMPTTVYCLNVMVIGF